MCIAIYGTNNHERTMEILYKLENKLHNRNCCKFARTSRQQVGQSELVYFEMRNMHYELENQYNIAREVACRSAKLADTPTPWLTLLLVL